MAQTYPPSAKGDSVGPAFGSALAALPLAPLQPVLRRIVHKIAAQYPSMFARLGPHQSSVFLIEPQGLPFRLLLRPDPKSLMFRAIPRSGHPTHVARISGRFFDLLRLVDADEDGDALFFSRELLVTGDTEAVVSLRNALDDVDGSIAESVAEMFGAPGRATLTALRKRAQKPNSTKDHT
jgi:predicted lipid carrier protein YhbT